jgi:ribonucleoside-diphosphate reductase alpha chain
MIVNKDTEISLRKLGYDEEQIKDVSRFILKNNTVRNAPYVKPEHYPIFDTAYGNLKGEGSIHINGHLKMLGAIQPFISGAISKTNNLPESATVKDIYDSYLLGDELGLKAVSVFRNNSKPSSALTLGAKSYKEFKRGEKEDLPPRRGAFESEVKIHSPLLKDTISFHMIVSEYENGKPGQIAFLSYKSGSVLRDLFANVGVQASKALKRGEHLEDIAEGWIGQEFEPKGFVSGHPYIKVALSPLDFAAKLLKLEYLGDTSVAQEPEKVNLRELRGFQNGAFRTYQREKVDEWNIEDVLKDPELGGFVEPSGQIFLANPNENGNRNARGKVCMGCGNLMNQVGPNCFQCTTCGDKIGGCGI